MARARLISVGSYVVVVVVVAGVVATSACEGRRTITGEPVVGHLTIRVLPAPTIGRAAQALGWPVDAVPRAIVVVTRKSAGAGTALADTASTGASGIVRFADLAAVEYSVTITRPLTSDEESAAGDALDNILSFAGAGAADLSVFGDDSVDVELRAVDSGSLVFSEIYPTYPLDGRGSFYTYDNYWEVYNNADTASAADFVAAPGTPGRVP